MGRNKNEVTPAERAAIYYHIYGNCDNWRELYIIACNPDQKRIASNSLKDYVSKWKNSQKIRDLVDLVKYEKTKKEKELIESEIRAENGGDNESTKKPVKKPVASFIDYSDPVNQKNKLNELVNSAEYGRDALDALKTIINTQKEDRDAAKEQKQVRTYLPLLCYNCPLYNKLKKG